VSISTANTSAASVYRYRYVAAGGETSISGVDSNGATLSYLVGKEQVYYNGVLLSRGQDYTATDGATIGSLAALQAGDTLEIITFSAFNLATITNATITASTITYAINAQTSSYTPVLNDGGAVVTMTSASANTFSIPTNSSVGFPVGSSITIIQAGAGQTTIQAVTSGTTTVASTGATASAPKLRAQYSTATVLKIATDTWYVFGDIL
jgi:hypothetical protein